MRPSRATTRGTASGRAQLMVALAVALSFAAWSVLSTSVHAEGEVEVGLAADRSELTVGDVATLTLTVTHPAGHRVMQPRLDRRWGEFEVRAVSRPTTSSVGGDLESTTQTIDVTLFAPGSFDTPELPVTVRDDLGNVSSHAAAPVTFTVVSVLSGDDLELKDIRPQASLPFPLFGLFESGPPVWLWIVLAVALALAAAAGWILYWRSQARRRLATAIDPRMPYEIAMDELARIDALGLLDRGRFKEHYTLVSEVLRGYVEQAFHVPALDLTTEELREAIAASGLDPSQAGRMLETLAGSDLVKFARLRPETSDAKGLTTEVRDVVDATRPAVPAVGGGAA